MNRDKKTVTWEETIAFYTDLIDKCNWEQKPMLELIDTFKNNNFWHKYYPSTSHSALGLSLECTYEKRLKVPMVYIVYNHIKKEFEIKYQKGQGNTILEKTVGTELAYMDFTEIEKWLFS